MGFSNRGRDALQTRPRGTYKRVERNGEVVFDGVLHRDSYEPLVAGNGNAIPPTDVPVARVDP